MQAMEESQVCNALELRSQTGKVGGQLACLAGAPAQRWATTITVTASPGQSGWTEEVEVQDGREDVEAAQNWRPPLLCSSLGRLRTLWDERTQGIGGNKPAKEFTREEQGREE